MSLPPVIAKMISLHVNLLKFSSIGVLYVHFWFPQSVFVVACYSCWVLVGQFSLVWHMWSEFNAKVFEFYLVSCNFNRLDFFKQLILESSLLPLFQLAQDVPLILVGSFFSKFFLDAYGFDLVFCFTGACHGFSCILIPVSYHVLFV